MTDFRVKALCEEFEIEIIPGNRYPQPGQTRAVASIRRLIDHHGEEHARLVLCVLAEGCGNQGLIDEYSLNAISSVLRACPDIMEKSASAVLELFDRIPLGPYMMVAGELRGTVHQGNALAGMLYLHMRQLRDDPFAWMEASATKKRKAKQSEAEKGREMPTAV